MNRIGKIVAGALMMAGTATAATLSTTAPADAGVSVGIGIGIPGPRVVYGPGYYPPGPCFTYRWRYSGWCGYPVYADPVWVGGVWYQGPHYYRWWGGRPWLWFRGGWHDDYRGGWHGHWHR